LAILAESDLVVIAESQWDAIAFIDLYKLFERGADRPWAAISTRGAANGHIVPADLIKADARVMLLRQNDPADANWFRDLPYAVQVRGRLVRPPEGVKDLNDWMRVETNEEIKRKLTK
jgi:hypothetical protein